MGDATLRVCILLSVACFFVSISSSFAFASFLSLSCIVIRSFLKHSIGLDKHNVELKTVNFFLPEADDTNYQVVVSFASVFCLSVFTYVLGAQKNRLIETVLLSTHNICFS